MRKVILCFRQPNEQQYVGGVSTVINNYLEEAELFAQNGIELGSYSYNPGRIISNVKSSKLKNVLFGIGQIKNTKKIIINPTETIFHIHTSREFLFLKDVILAAYVKRKYRGIRVMMTIHVGSIDTVYKRISFFKNLTIRLMNKYIDHIFFLSNEIANEFYEAGVARGKSSVLYNFHTLKDSNNPTVVDNGNKVNLLFIGSVHKEKGIMDLLYALKDLDDKMDYHLDICGQVTDKNIENDFNNMLQENQKISFRGYVQGKEKADLLQNADILILPSYHEGLPLVILEALAAGCAIIVTKVGAIPEILNNDNAIWVDIADPDSIKNAVEYLVDNKDILRSMKLNNYQLSKKFSIHEHINKLCEVYDESKEV